MLGWVAVERVTFDDGFEDMKNRRHERPNRWSVEIGREVEAVRLYLSA